MLKFKEIKKDIRNGCQYMEYTDVWYDMRYNIVLENDTIVFLFQWDYLPAKWLYEHEAIFSMNVNDFMAIESYKEYIKKINECIYYNTYCN